MSKKTLIIPTEEELAKITNPEGLQKRLGSFRARLIEMVNESQEVKETIFAQRTQIAAILKNFGSKEDKDLAAILEELTSSDFSLSTTTPVKPKSKQRIERKSYECPGYFVFGNSVTDAQRRHMTSESKYRKYGQKVGDPMHLDLTSLFRIDKDPSDISYATKMSKIFFQKEETRPIYINCELDISTRTQLSALIRLRPDLEQQIFVMTWSKDDKLTLTPVREALSQTQKDEEDRPLTIKELKILDFALYHQPTLGEVYKGQITEIKDCCMFIEILPGIEGMAFYTNLPPPYNNRGYLAQHQGDFQVGDQLTVEVIKVEEKHFRHIGLQVIAPDPKQTTSDTQTTTKTIFETAFPDFFQKQLLESQN